jgi:hypothetical protein
MAKSSDPSATSGKDSGGTPHDHESRGVRLRLWVVLGAVVVTALLLLGGFPGISLNAPAPPTYRVAFHEVGLPVGRSWGITLGSTIETVNGSTWVNFSRTNGVYGFSAFYSGTDLYDWYYAFPPAGMIRIDGHDQFELIHMEPPRSIASAFAWGTPYNLSGTTAVGCPLAVGHYCYSLEISRADVITTYNFGFAMLGPSPCGLWPPGTSVSLVAPPASGVVANYNMTEGGWDLVPPFNGTLAGGDTFMFYTSATGAGEGMAGIQVCASGLDGFTAGWVASSPFP